MVGSLWILSFMIYFFFRLTVSHCGPCFTPLEMFDNNITENSDIKIT